MITTPDGVKIYFNEDIEPALQTAREEQDTYTARKTNLANREATYGVMKEEARNGSMTKEDALELFNKIADACGWDTADKIGSTYSVEILIQGNTVLTLDEVEADDEHDAEQIVMDDLNFEDIELSFTATALGEANTDTIGDDSFRIDLAGTLQELVEIRVTEND